MLGGSRTCGCSDPSGLIRQRRQQGFNPGLFRRCTLCKAAIFGGLAFLSIACGSEDEYLAGILLFPVPQLLEQTGLDCDFTALSRFCPKVYLATASSGPKARVLCGY